MPDAVQFPAEINLAFVEDLYAAYLRDPDSVSAHWRQYFESFDASAAPAVERDLEPSALPASALPPSEPPRDFPPPSEPTPPAPPAREPAVRTEPLPEAPDGSASQAGLQQRVDKLVGAYRVRGHVVATIDPLGLPRPTCPELDPSFHGLSEQDLDRKISPHTLSGCSLDTPRLVLERLRETYTRSVGAQFMHIDDLGVRDWLQKRMESVGNHVQLSQTRQIRIFTRLTDATIFEDFIQKKFTGAKSFSLEGCETAIPLLDLLIERVGRHGVNDIVIGMAHRGRLNVLANVLGKNAAEIFREFADLDHEHYDGRGDVKYHLGYRNDLISSRGDSIRVSLCFNPSHLEFVDPVAIGRVRARQDRKAGHRRMRGLCILLHGDAAFVGEGVVQETLNMSQLPGYTIGGTIHVIVNNQIGFTTTPEQGRSSTYASGAAKMLQIPIFHVNGEDPEAVAQVVRLAVDFRNEYQRDVVIDMYGYRRRGHNETDEPRFTQPITYRAIQQRKPVREAYLERLLNQGGITREEADRIAQERREHLERELVSSKSDDYIYVKEQITGDWAGYRGGPDARVEDLETGAPRAELAAILEKLSKVPAGFHPDRRIERMLKLRSAMARGEAPVDWSAAEALAFGSLVLQGFRVRLTGQDCERGTFSHRHAVLCDAGTGQRYTPLEHLSHRQGVFEVHNSPLSEAGPLGFEYGYSMEWPDGLILWEAQFGDFVNAAQVIVDQFIFSAEDKWSLRSGLIMLLPHGFEGQGPEHSSARLERFLQLAAEENVQIVSPTTPAQYFHLLRRQVLRPWRKPLIVMSPKSLLRHPDVGSPLEDLTGGRYQRILPDPRPGPEAVRRVLVCAGKIYYDLATAREGADRKDLALLRLEQLYPLSAETLQAALAPFEGAEVWWVQEEPLNMGAWRFLQVRFPGMFARVVSRPESGSTATGSPGSHQREQRRIIEEALAVEAA